MLTLKNLRRADAQVHAQKLCERVLWIARAGDSVTTLRSMGAPQHVIDIVRAAVPGMGSDSALAEVQLQTMGFLANVANVGFADALLADAWPGQLNSQFAVGISDAAAGLAADGRSIRVTSAGFARRTLNERVIGAIVVLSNTLLRHGVALDLIERLLAQAISRAADAIVVPELLTGAPTIAASGISSSAVLFDVRRAVTGIPSGPDARFHIGVSAGLAKRLALATDASGARAFPAMRINGGTIADIGVSVTEALNADVIVTDAAALLGASGALEIERSRNTSIEMATDPTSAIDDGASPAQPIETTQVSMFQAAATALKITRAFDLVPLRTLHTVKISGAGNLWGLDNSTSPPS